MSASRRLAWGSSAAVTLVAICVFVAGLAASGCGHSSETAPSGSAAARTVAGTVRLFAWEDAFASPLIKPFQEEYPHVKLETAAFSSEDEEVAKLRAGFKADVLNTDLEGSALPLIRLGLLQPIDVSKIPAWSDLFPTFKKLDGVVVNGKVYVVPCVAGITGIVYNPKYCTSAPRGFKDLFLNPAYKGRVGMVDSPLVAIEAGALAMGIKDPTHLNSIQLEQVKSFYLAHKDQFRALWSTDSDVLDLFRTGEIDISLGYPGYVTELDSAGFKAKFVIPDEGQLMWVAGYGISKDCQNLPAAHALINYYLSPTAQAWQASNYFYMVSNRKTLEAVTPAVRKKAMLDAPARFTNSVVTPLPDNYNEWVMVWSEIKESL